MTNKEAIDFLLSQGLFVTPESMAFLDLLDNGPELNLKKSTAKIALIRFCVEQRKAKP